MKGGELAVMSAHLTRYHGEKRPGETRGALLDDSLPIQTVENRFGIVGVTLTQHQGQSIALDVEGALGAQTQNTHHAVTAAFLAQHNTGVYGHMPDEPISSLTTRVTQQQIAGAYLVYQRGTATALDIENPGPALTTGGNRGGDHVGVAAAFLSEYYGTGGQHQAIDVPLNTLSTRDRFALAATQAGVSPLTEAQYARAKQVAEFSRRYGAWNGGEVVVFGPWIMVDIGMRMILPKEAAAAHELKMPETITIKKRDRKGAVCLDENGKPIWITRPLSKTEAMRLIGNSVPKRLPKLLVSLNAQAALGRQIDKTAFEAA